jgi:hypothetical protein
MTSNKMDTQSTQLIDADNESELSLDDEYTLENQCELNDEYTDFPKENQCALNRVYANRLIEYIFDRQLYLILDWAQTIWRNHNTFYRLETTPLINNTHDTVPWVETYEILERYKISKQDANKIERKIWPTEQDFTNFKNNIDTIFIDLLSVPTKLNKLAFDNMVTNYEKLCKRFCPNGLLFKQLDEIFQSIFTYVTLNNRLKQKLENEKNNSYKCPSQITNICCSSNCIIM